MSTLYLKGLAEYGKGNIDWENDTIKLRYMATSYTANAGTHQYWSDISASEASGAPTETLANCAVNEDSGNSRTEFDCDNPSTGSITTTTDKFVVYKDTGVDSTSPLIYCGDIGTTLSPVSGTLALTFDSNGIFALNAAVS